MFLFYHYLTPFFRNVDIISQINYNRLKYTEMISLYTLQRQLTLCPRFFSSYFVLDLCLWPIKYYYPSNSEWKNDWNKIDYVMTLCLILCSISMSQNYTSILKHMYAVLVTAKYANFSRSEFKYFSVNKCVILRNYSTRITLINYCDVFFNRMDRAKHNVDWLDTRWMSKVKCQKVRIQVLILWFAWQVQYKVLWSSNEWTAEDELFVLYYTNNIILRAT